MAIFPIFFLLYCKFQSPVSMLNLINVAIWLRYNWLNLEGFQSEISHCFTNEYKVNFTLVKFNRSATNFVSDYIKWWCFKWTRPLNGCQFHVFRSCLQSVKDTLKSFASDGTCVIRAHSCICNWNVEHVSQWCPEEKFLPQEIVKQNLWQHLVELI